MTTDQAADPESDDSRTAPARRHQLASDDPRVVAVEMGLEKGVFDDPAKTQRLWFFYHGEELIEHVALIVRRWLVGVSVPCVPVGVYAYLFGREEVRNRALIVLGLSLLFAIVVLALTLLLWWRRGKPTSKNPAENRVGGTSEE